MKKLSLDIKIGILGLIMVSIAIAILISGVVTHKVYGDSSYFAQPAKSGTATTTVSYMVAGSSTIATSTPVVYDSYNIYGSNQTSNGANDSADSLALLEYVNASSSLSVFRTNIEYSDGVDVNGNFVDCKTTPTACDWYENNLDMYTTGATAIALPNTYSYTYASTTRDTTLSGPAAGENRGSKIISVKTPTRFVRAYVSMSGANGSVSLKFLPKKQYKN